MAVKYPYEYDPEKRRIAKIYTKTKIVNGIFNSMLLPIVFYVVLLYSGISLDIRDLSLAWGGVFYVPLYIVIFLTMITAVQLPLSFYSEFVYEHKYGLSNQNVRAWLKDFFKELALSYVISVPILTGLYVLIGMTPLWYVYAALIYICLTAFFDYIYPIVIFPIFYKTKPFEDEGMRKKIFDILDKMGVKNIKRIDVACESEKSNKANACFAGIGGSKRIILFDTLVSGFTADEVETVVAHELGHYVHKDILRFTVIESLKIVPVFLVIIAVFERFSSMFGIGGVSDIAGLPLLLLVSSAIEIVLMGPMMAYSRKREKAADIFALEATGKVDAQVSCEKRLCDMNLSDDSAHPLVEYFLFSHPCAEKRIEYALEWGRENKD